MTNVTIKVGQSYIAIEAGGIKIGTMGTLELESTGRILPVAYEDLCQRTMGVMEEIFAFLDLPMSDKTREFVTASTSVQRDGFYGVYKDPVQAAHKWRKGLDEEQTATIERYLSESVLARYWQPAPEHIGS